MELGAVRQAFIELKCEKDRIPIEQWPCQACRGVGCFQCCPLLTCLVSQTSQNKIRLAPADPNDRSALATNKQRSNRSADLANVPSGTCVDAADLLLPLDCKIHEEQIKSQILKDNDDSKLQLFSDQNENNQDFFLVANHGLKGTSKGVLYRVIWNENLFRGRDGSSPLTISRLQRLIFALSFLYPKATKAPRETCVVKTASQLANTLLGVMSALGTLENQYFIREENTGEDGGQGRVIYRLKTTENGSLLPFFGPRHALHPHVVA